MEFTDQYTHAVFVDYMRATIRVAALAELPTTYILTHDSIGVGEDGPTHQPVETVSSLRTFPNLDVMRPADAEETVGAYVHSATRKTGPTALILTRQNVKEQSQIPKEVRARALTAMCAVMCDRESDCGVLYPPCCYTCVRCCKPPSPR